MHDDALLGEGATGGVRCRGSSTNFKKIRERGAALRIFKVHPLDRESRASIVIDRGKVIGSRGRFRVLLPGRALELEAGSTRAPRDERRASLATEFAVEERQLVAAMDRLFAADMNISARSLRLPRCPALSHVDEVDEEKLSLTIDDMGTSLYRWARIDEGEHIPGLLR